MQLVTCAVGSNLRLQSAQGDSSQFSPRDIINQCHNMSEDFAHLTTNAVFSVGIDCHRKTAAFKNRRSCEKALRRYGQVAGVKDVICVVAQVGDCEL